MTAQNARAQITECVVAPETAGADLRKKLGLKPDDPLRISYIPGPGDLLGTFEHWRNGAFDPRSPSIAYSTMLFELGKRLNADLQVIMRGDPAMPPQRTDNVVFSRIPMRPMNSLVGYWRALFDFAVNCRKEIKAFKPHIVIVVSNFFWGAFPFLRVGKARLVLTAHTTCWPMGERKIGLRRRIENVTRRVGLAAVHAGVNISAECARQVATLSPKPLPTRVAYPQQRKNFIPAGAGEDKHSHEDGGRAILYLGRIEENKGVFDLLDAFKAVREETPDARLVIAGSGGAESRLRAHIDNDFPKGAIDYRGGLGAAGVHQLLKQAYVLVCPTRTSFCEGNAAVCFEAAVHGAPVIASSVVPACEKLERGAVVYQADSVSGLTDALKRVLRDENLRDKLSKAIMEDGAVVFDRSKSWGSQLYLTMLDAAQGAGDLAEPSVRSGSGAG